MTHPADPTPAAAPSLADLLQAPPGAPHHVYANRCLAALAGCPMHVGLDVVLSLYRHLALNSGDKGCTATAAFATAVLSQELSAAAGVQVSPSTLN